MGREGALPGRPLKKAGNRTGLNFLGEGFKTCLELILKQVSGGKQVFNR
jgi:hypothetical protein